MNFKSKILSILILLSLSCFAIEQEIPASKLYQDLGKEAQFALGIPEEYHLQIKQDNVRKNIAYVNKAGIYVNEVILKPYSYGFKRCTMFHEVAHIKNNDIYLTEPFYMFSKQQQLMEKKADIIGYYASECFFCVREKAYLIKGELKNWFSGYLGYLQFDQVEKIAEELKQQNKICAYHEKY